MSGVPQSFAQGRPIEINEHDEDRCINLRQALGLHVLPQEQAATENFLSFFFY